MFFLKNGEKSYAHNIFWLFSEMRAFQSQVLFLARFFQVRFGIIEKWTFLKCPKSSFENQTQKNTFLCFYKIL
jgi:hypothetical protein